MFLNVDQRINRCHLMHGERESKRIMCKLLTALAVICISTFHQVQCQVQSSSSDFQPLVTARCELGNMTILVQTESPFEGVVHVKDYRKPPCQTFGNGQRNTTLLIDLLTAKDSPNYCGVITNKGNEQSLVLAVRVHRNLELSDDKFYLITCGKSDFRNSRNQMSRVSMHFTDGQRNLTELVYGHRYTLRASISKPDGIYDMQVRSCISFAPNTTEVQLLDSNGCPVGNIISEFHSNDSKRYMESTLYSAFRFFGSNQVHVQCEIILCRDKCVKVYCNNRPNGPLLPRPLARSNLNDGNQIHLLASTSAFVVNPGDPAARALTSCSEWQFPWLIGLCICLAILLLVMLIVNIFLCSSVTCLCTRSEVSEKDPSEIEDYDPYKVGWSSSHYGSRTSLNKAGYMSGAESTVHSGSSASDHYATVQSRPGSGYSHHSSREPLHLGHRRPGSAFSNSCMYEPRL